MLEIAVVGEPEFTMGFRFAGIRNVKDVGEGAAEESLRQMLKE
ncbi:TPA: V-type ATP synthase subunit F, partial [Candidatus Woesearchaeota archaeon]|nr:V-type ATP synthase subunit F [Candidatus Woesearchaeota archaeon]